MAAEDIAARFGVTPTAVKQHLKLGAVSPRLVQAYRDEELSLDELTAFATPTTMHDRNESGASYRTTTAAATPSFGRCQGHVSSDDRARFSSEAYQAAGGAIARDLFDEEGGGFFADTASDPPAGH